MNGNEVLRIVDAIHRDKGIDKEIVFEGIEQAILSAARKHYGEDGELEVQIARETGEPSVRCDGEELDPEVLGDLLGRISAQTAKQVMIQKIREAERDALYDEYVAMRSQIVTGSVTRVDRGAATVNLGKVEAVLPRSHQIPGESYRVGERVRAVITDVNKAGTRLRIVLSRTHPDFVRRLFELEIPEVAEHVIEVRSIAREAGYRTKVAVSCYDSKIDCVGACVGVRGSRIKGVVDELGGERIDIVRWNDSLQVLVPNALQPAEIEDVILCPMLGKVIVLVRDDQLSLAIGRKGQNVRLASKLVGWDINVLTQEKLDELLDKSVEAFAQVPDVNDELAENLVSQGFFTFDDLSVIEPDQLAELGGLTAEQCERIVSYADAESIRLEQLEEEERQAAMEGSAAQQQAEEERQRQMGVSSEPAPAHQQAGDEQPDQGGQPDQDEPVSVQAAESAESAETEEALQPSEAGSSPSEEVAADDGETSEPAGGEENRREEATGEQEVASDKPVGAAEQEIEQSAESADDGGPQRDSLSKAEASAPDQ